MNEHPRAIAARLSHSPNVAARECGYAVTASEVRAIRDLRYARMDARLCVDPLLVAQQTRPSRKRAALAATDARYAAAKAEREAERDRARRRAKLAAAIRSSLIAAAREARKLGFSVRRSTDRAGRVSSYYIGRPETRPIRISDHEIPATPEREWRAAESGRGFYDGYPGPQILITGPKRPEWLRRAIVLAAAGRLVPGA